MRRLRYTSLLLEAREVASTAIPGFPPQSKTGEEHLCAVCAKRKGKFYDSEARLVCDLCR